MIREEWESAASSQVNYQIPIAPRDMQNVKVLISICHGRWVQMQLQK